MNKRPIYQSFRDIKKILVIKLKHIGDVLLSSPCIRSLHETFPSAKLSILLNEGTEPVFNHHPLLTEVITFSRSTLRKGSLSKRIQQEWKFARNLRNRHFDLVVDLTSGDRAAWYAWLSGARYRIAYDPQGKGFFGKHFLYTHLAPYPTSPDIHQVKKDVGILEYLGVPSSHFPLEMYLADQDSAYIQETLELLKLKKDEKFVLVHPTSRWLFKCWEDQRFAQLIDWVQERHKLPVVFTCGPDLRELKRAHQIFASCSVKPRTLFDALSLTQWAALAKQSRMFIGVDSAPMHIAASQGVSCVALFGPTGFQNWRPWSVQHTVLVHDCPCSRDRLPQCDWNKTRACMAKISLEEVQTAVNDLLH